MIPALKPKGNKINRIKRTFAAGEDFTFQADCRFFYFQEATYGFEVYLDDGPPLDFNLALGYECEEGEVMTTIRVRNTLSVSASITLVFGRGRLIDHRLNVLENRNGSAASLTPNGLELTDAGTLIAGASYNVAANPNAKDVLINFAAGAILNINAVLNVTDITGLYVLGAIGFPTASAGPQQPLTTGNVVFGFTDYVYGLNGPIQIVLKNYSGAFRVNNYSSIDLGVKIVRTIYN